jgi:EamA domain-containing membrane protein RarD
MNKKVRRWSLLIVCLLCSTITFAQEKQVEMADTMRSNGKIYTVVAVCLTILIGLFIYVFAIDRKLRKLEKEN